MRNFSAENLKEIDKTIRISINLLTLVNYGQSYAQLNPKYEAAIYQCRQLFYETQFICTAKYPYC